MAKPFPRWPSVTGLTICISIHVHNMCSLGWKSISISWLANHMRSCTHDDRVFINPRCSRVPHAPQLLPRTMQPLMSQQEVPRPPPAARAMLPACNPDSLADKHLSTLLPVHITEDCFATVWRSLSLGCRTANLLSRHLHFRPAV